MIGKMRPFVWNADYFIRSPQLRTFTEAVQELLLPWPEHDKSWISESNNFWQLGHQCKHTRQQLHCGSRWYGLHCTCTPVRHSQRGERSWKGQLYSHFWVSTGLGIDLNRWSPLILHACSHPHVLLTVCLLSEKKRVRRNLNCYYMAADTVKRSNTYR